MPDVDRLPASADMLTTSLPCREFASLLGRSPSSLEEVTWGGGCPPRVLEWVAKKICTPGATHLPHGFLSLREQYFIKFHDKSKKKQKSTKPYSQKAKTHTKAEKESNMDERSAISLEITAIVFGSVFIFAAFWAVLYCCYDVYATVRRERRHRFPLARGHFMAVDQAVVQSTLL